MIFMNILETGPQEFCLVNDVIIFFFSSEKIIITLKQNKTKQNFLQCLKLCLLNVTHQRKIVILFGVREQVDLKDVEPEQGESPERKLGFPGLLCKSVIFKICFNQFTAQPRTECHCD